MVFRQAVKSPRREPIIEKKDNRAPIVLSLPVAGEHEFSIKFSKLPTPKIGDKEIHDITIELDPLPFCAKLSLKKKQWNKLVKAVDAIEGGNPWIAVGRGKIQKIHQKVIHLENVGFQVFERKPKTEA